MSQPERVVYTIGHSTHPIEVFIAMLRSFDIRLLVDIRGLPGSNKYPQYNQEALQASLPASGIAYLHLPDLGGRRRVHRDSHNTRWRNASFRAYADYMETDDFARGIVRLMDEAERQPTAYLRRGRLVALSPLTRFGLSQGPRLASDAHHRRGPCRGTSLHTGRPRGRQPSLLFRPGSL